MQKKISMEKRAKFGAFIKSHRKKNKYALRDVGRLCNIDYSLLAKIEKGKEVKIRMEYIERLSILFAVDYDNLCAMIDRIPEDIFWKIVHNPELLNVIRDYKA